MNEKQEAKRLVERFAQHQTNESSFENFIQAKQCALICVDEIIKNECCGFDLEDCHPLTQERVEYWQRVKEQIQLM